MDSFSKKLRERSKDLKISNAEVARRLGLSERRYAYYASGEAEPDLATLVKIATVLGISLDELLLPSIPKSKTLREKLLERVATSASALNDEKLDTAVTILEALVAAAGKRPPATRRTDTVKSGSRKKG